MSLETFDGVPHTSAQNLRDYHYVHDAAHALPHQIWTRAVAHPIHRSKLARLTHLKDRVQIVEAVTDLLRSDLVAPEIAWCEANLDDWDVMFDIDKVATVGFAFTSEAAAVMFNLAFGGETGES